MFDADSASDLALQRSHGAARLRFAVRHGRTRAVERYGAAPLRLLAPRTAGTAPEIVLANTAGGVAGGDSLAITVTASPGADASVTGQAAEKIYRALDEPARLTTTLTVEAGAMLEWLPQETILFDGARLDRRIAIDLAEDARLLLVDMAVFGRKAHGERFDAGGVFTDAWSVDRAGRPLWRDRLRLAGGDPMLDGAVGLRDGRALATILYAGPDGASLLEPLRDLIAASPIFGGVTLRQSLLIARMIGAEAGGLKQALTKIIGPLRALAPGRPAMAPRVWLC